MKIYNSGVSTQSPDKNTSGNIGKDGFLKILSAQLQHQDPMNAGDNTEYIAQMAQFSALEQMQNLNDSINAMITNQKVLEANMMIGKEVMIETENGDYISGEVQAAVSGSDTVDIMVEDNEYSIDDVVIVMDKESEEDVISDN